MYQYYIRTCALTTLAFTTGLNAYKLDTLVWNEVIDTTPDARNDDIPKFSGHLFHLCLDFAPDDFLVILHDGREGMRTKTRANEEMRGREVSDPVAQGFVNRVFQRFRTRLGTTSVKAKRSRNHEPAMVWHLSQVRCAREYGDNGDNCPHGIPDNFAVAWISDLRLELRSDLTRMPGPGPERL